jgi:hypothetical protein
MQFFCLFPLSRSFCLYRDLIYFLNLLLQPNSPLRIASQEDVKVVIVKFDRV